MDTFFLLILLAAAYLLIGPGLGIAAFVQARRSLSAAAELRRRLARIERLVDEIARPRPEIDETAAPAVPVQPAPAAPSAPPAAAIAPAAVVPVPPAPAPVAFKDFEQRLASRWMLWLGGVALALGGVFLVKYAVEEGWLGPATRVVLGFSFGCALTAAGEWLRQRPSERAIAAVRPDHVPPALSAAGLFIAFASVYAAFALYDLIGPLLAFTLLAALSAGAVFLSLLQGPFTALLGIVGGFATPLLIPTEQPLAWGLFLYLGFVVASALTVVRFTAAEWLSRVTAAAALLWPGIWYATAWRPGDAAPLGSYLLLVCGLFLFVPSREAPAPQRPGASERTSWGAIAAAALLIFVLLRMDAYGPASRVVLGLFILLSLTVGRRLPSFEAMPLLAEALALGTLATWHLPRILTTASPFYSYPSGYAAGPVVPPELDVFLSTAIAGAALLGIGAFASLRQGRRPQLWASVSASAPVLLLLICYWRIEAFGLDLWWSAAAAALAVIEAAAAAQCLRRREVSGMTVALAAYASAAVAALSLAATMALQQAWLTVAMSVQLPALAWIGARLKLDVLRPVALAVAGVVLVRLVFNYQVLEYPLGGVPGLNWMLYGYGLPSASFFLAAEWFRRDADDRLVTVLELGALAFAALLVTLELHNLVTGPLTQPPSGLLEPSLQAIALLSMAIGIARSGWRSARRAAVWARHCLAALAVAQILLWNLLIQNPLWSDEPVGDTPVLNLLLLAFGIPAVLIAVYSSLASGGALLRQAGGALALALGFVDLSLEVRRSFQGPLLSQGISSDAEWYVYSAAWLGYAGLLLGLGIGSRSRALRYASLAVLLIVIGKVFLSDMADLTGLYRVASVAGLGLSLIAVGYLYQRFVFPLPPLPDRDLAA